jgi:hypothetical protein
VCLGHYASRGLRDPLRGGKESKLVGIEITDSATIRYRREKVRSYVQDGALVLQWRVVCGGPPSISLPTAICTFLLT